MSSDSNPPVALTIAGSDSGGAAGIQADLKTFAALGVFGTSAITAVTAQNTVAVRGVHPIPVDFVLAQVLAVLDDLPVGAVKTGMLATTDVVEMISTLAAAGQVPNLVVDPVILTSQGDRMFEPELERRYLHQLFPHAAVVTPNLREATTFLGNDVRTVADQHDAARALAAYGPQVVVVKGGHATGDTSGEAVDVVWSGGATYELRRPRVATGNNHGSGCSFASAIAAGLAAGLDTVAAIDRAKDFVWRGVRGGATWSLGAGHGPLDHFGWADR